MKIKETELRKIIRQSLLERYKQNPQSINKLADLQENSDFGARRLVMIAVEAVIVKEIEQNIIVKELDIIDPNKMGAEMQAKYMDIVVDMSNKIGEAIKDAVLKLTPFPRNGQNNGDMK